MVQKLHVQLLYKRLVTKLCVFLFWNTRNRMHHKTPLMDSILNSDFCKSYSNFNYYRKDLQISCTFFPKICDQNRRCGLSARPFRTASNVQSSIVRYYAWLHSFAECMQENNKFTRKILWKNCLEWRNTCEQIPE